MRRFAVFIGSLLLAGCSGPLEERTGYDPYGPPISHPVSKVVKDSRPAFCIDPDRPWRLEFGRGGGWHGFDTAKLDQTGRLILHRLKSESRGNTITISWETATAELPAEAVAKVLKAVEENHLLELDKAYHAAVEDGTQWILWIRQGGREKSVYFDNHFPDSIVRFARRLDEILARSAGPNLRWRAVPAAEERKHERELWESINR
jgi:hypothetical protein